MVIHRGILLFCILGILAGAGQLFAQNECVPGYYALHDGDMSRDNDIIVRLEGSSEGECRAVEIQNGVLTGEIVLRFLPPGSRSRGFGQPVGIVYSQHLYPQTSNPQWIQLFDIRFRSDGFSIFSRGAQGWHYYRLEQEDSQTRNSSLVGNWKFRGGNIKAFVHRGGNYYEGYFRQLSEFARNLGFQVGDLSYKLWLQQDGVTYRGQVLWRWIGADRRQAWLDVTLRVKNDRLEVRIHQEGKTDSASRVW